MATLKDFIEENNRAVPKPSRAARKAFLRQMRAEGAREELAENPYNPRVEISADARLIVKVLVAIGTLLLIATARFLTK